jgi:hypothetical protein
MVSFEASKTEYRIIGRIVKRAKEIAESQGVRLDAGQLEMDIVVCHMNGCRLDLERLLAFDDGSFGHDVFGIRKYIDRSTGELTECFLPRCADPV